MTDDERDQFCAVEIKAGRCPFGMLKVGQTIGHCPSGFPGCGCGDELILNPYLQQSIDTKTPCVCSHSKDLHWFKGDGTIVNCSVCGCQRYRPEVSSDT